MSIWKLFAVTNTSYLKDSQITVVVEPIIGLILREVERYSAQQDHTVQLLSKNYNAVGGIDYYPIS